MASCTFATSSHGSGVILRPEEFARHARLERAIPHPSMSGHVEHYWSVHWNLPEGARHLSVTLPGPSISITREWGGLEREAAPGPGSYLTGVMSRRRFEVQLIGTGGVVGVKFRPGGWAALTGADAGLLRDRVVPFIGLPGELTGRDAPGAAAILDRWLQAFGPVQGERLEDLQSVRRLLQVLTDPGITQVAQLAEQLSMSVRSLQRLSGHYIGVGPTWLVRRARIRDAVAQLDSGYQGSFAELAAELGWADQAHFSRDFRALIGQTPRAYRGRRRAG